MTIGDAAEKALRHIGRPSTIHEIYETILTLRLYSFNTDIPEHVLRTEIRRKTDGVERVDSSQNALFRLAGDEIYDVVNAPIKRRNAIGMKRIHRATDKEDIIKLLTSDSLGIFREIWRLLLFSAVLGYKQNRREKLAAVETGKGIDQSSFSNNPAWPGILYLICLVDSDSTNVLTASENSEDERITIFEEFANGGLAVLKEQFTSTNCSMDTLLTYIQTEVPSDTGGTPNLQITI